MTRSRILALLVAAASLVAMTPVVQQDPGGDAGSGRDAGETPETAVAIEPGVTHTATLDTAAVVDPFEDPRIIVPDVDLFRIEVPAGSTLQTLVTVPGQPGAEVCGRVVDADGQPLDGPRCGSNHVPASASDRVLHLEVSHSALDVEVAREYQFATSLDHVFDDTPPRQFVAVAEDDGGSGRDAGDSPLLAARIDVGATVAGTMTPLDDDWYRVDLDEGVEYATVLTGAGLGGCVAIRDADLEVRNDARACFGDTYVADRSGPHFFAVSQVYGDYRFTVVAARDLLGLDAPEPDERPEPELGDPTVVVLSADSGVNPYHEVYRRPELTEHPCTWVVGYDDCDVPALELSLGVYDDVEEAYAADAEAWAAVEPGRHYWIPGTNIIAAACGTGSIGIGPTALGVGRCILDDEGHGTGVSSSVVTEAPDALLIIHDAPLQDVTEPLPVIPDVQTSSVAQVVPIPGLLLPGVEFGPVHDESLFFQGAGNEGAFPTPLAGDRVDPRTQVVGGGAPGQWTGGSWTVFDFASWYCRPTALHTTTTGVDPEYCGTSFAAPTVAGTAAAAVLEIRRELDFAGRSTLDEVAPGVSRDAFLQGLRSAATHTDVEQTFPNDAGTLALPLPSTQPYLFWGHGFLDRTEVPAIVACALHGECEQDTPEEARWHELRRQAREVLHDPEQFLPPTPPFPSVSQDDAGSGRDAGNVDDVEADPSTAVPVELGVTYAGQSLPRGIQVTLDEDSFRFEGASGDRLRVTVEVPAAVRVLGRAHIASIEDPSTPLARADAVPGEPIVFDVTLPSDGTYVLVRGSSFDVPHEYTFRIDLR